MLIIESPLHSLNNGFRWAHGAPKVKRHPYSLKDFLIKNPYEFYLAGGEGRVY